MPRLSASITTSIILSLLAGLSLAAAWLLPGTVESAILGFIAAFSILLLVRTSPRPYTFAYISAVISHLIGFYWLVATIRDFGGFSPALSALIFTFFIVASALQFIVFVFLYRNLHLNLAKGDVIDRLGIRGASAWVAAEVLSIRIFPWHMGHTQLGFLTFAQIADIGGALLLSFLMFFVAEACINAIKAKSVKYLPAPLSLMLASLIYGHFSLQHFSNLEQQTQKVALVQANISIEEKHNIRYFGDNAESYRRLSQGMDSQDTLIIWPESVIMDWVFTDIGHAALDDRLPARQAIDSRNSFLIGALTFNRYDERFNSALAVFSDGRVPYPYHKKILMPFGEYMPFSGIFPWLENLNPAGGHFTAGRKLEVFKFPMAGERTVKVSPLICYEDVVPSLSRRAVKRGAQVLVNLTNDAWFGKTAAPFQHHLIASFRAIETRRYLLRSTNSGLTAIVNPAGKTTASLPIFSEGVIKDEITPLDYRSIYSYAGEKPWWILALLCCIISVYNVAKRKSVRKS